MVPEAGQLGHHALWTREEPADGTTGDPRFLAIVSSPTFRADMWAEMEGTPGLKAAEIARRTYGSFATAWQVKRDWSTWAGRTGR